MTSSADDQIVRDVRLARSNLSPLNVRLTEPDGRPIKVDLREITLRQLVHLDSDLTIDEKVYWLRCLDEARVPFTVLKVADNDSDEIVARARDAGLRIQPDLSSQVQYQDSWPRVIATARASGTKRVSFSSRGSNWALEAMGNEAGRSVAEMRRATLDEAVRIIKAAKDADLNIRIDVAYAFQAERSYLEELAGSYHAAGLDILGLPDSVGAASPAATSALVSAIKDVVDINVAVHCHNDCGFSLGNAIAAVEAGARTVDVCVNGADPHRAGLTSLAELAVALELYYGVDTGINLAALTGLARKHASLLGWTIPTNAPLVGAVAFAQRVAEGSYAAFEPGEMIDATRDPFYAAPDHDEPFNPEAVGNSHVLLLGKYSAPNAVAAQLTTLGVEFSGSQLTRIVAMVQDRGRSRKSPVSDDELLQFVDVVS